MIIISIIIAIFLGNPNNIITIISEASIKAINNIIKLAGMTCFWSGIFNILKSTTLIKSISKFVGKITIKLFDKKEISEEVMNNISLNVTCNLIGVGNAATVYGIKAIEQLNELNQDKNRASDSMCMFVLLNTASLQLIPTSIIAMRAMYNSTNITAIIIPVWIITILALLVGIMLCKISNKII